ncbi:MAG: hypothetical protein COV72_07150 [Candidatus Omnitrophica bacterium CG11_big_fil_rev_8_21_14_0_20_42_13]|uniref:DUF6933 domain-containing protein n=1 Tax=Candidatus Ghiorseimicrobium undicola TaxID=1974746 RepID=A0A2H0LWF8_9BACT|nr:MAG: hypothetical protein COV72_07150 [Candidatus Omnitrophica bacterium CG11_big_fil_rev_8_21_14_0_20_42_13]
MLIRCTVKLLKELNLAASELTDSVPSELKLGEWFANLFFIERKKCLIFTNTRTLFTFISFAVNRTQIKNIGELFRAGLGKALLDEDFDGAVIQRLVDECHDMQFSKTNNKSVLGAMNDHVKTAKWMVWRDGGLGKCNFPHLIKKLNRTPFSTRRFAYAIEELGKVLGIEIDPRLNFKPKFVYG